MIDLKAVLDRLRFIIVTLNQLAAAAVAHAGHLGRHSHQPKGCKPEEVDMVELFPDSKDYSQVFAEHPISAFDPATLPDYSDKE